MKRIDTSAVTASTGFPVKSGSLQHIQAAYGEAIAESVKSLIGLGYDPTKVYVLSGLINSGAGLVYNITAGSVFFNGEVYLVPAFAGTIVGPSVLVGVITVSFFSAVNADPVEFTDGVPRNVHQIRQIILQSGLSGSGAANYVDFKKAFGSQIPVNASIDYLPATLDLSEFDGTGLGISANVQGWAICNGNNGTVDESGLVVVGYKSGDADFGTLAHIAGEKAHVLLITEMADHKHTESVADVAGGGSAGGRTGTTGAASNTSFMNGGTGGAANPHNNLQPYIVKLRIQRIY
jgi:hypothetical protein